MSGGGMQAQQGVGTAASGGKGGQMGGPSMPNTADVSPATQAPAGGKGGGVGQGGGMKEFGNLALTQGSLGSGGFRGNLPDGSGGVSQMPADTAAQPTAFETGLNAMNSGMDWMGNAMNYQAPTLGGDYNFDASNAAGVNGQQYMNDLATGRAQQAVASMMSAPGRDLYDYDAALAQGQSYNAAQLADKNINDYMNPYTQNVIDTTMADLDKARQQALNSTGAAATAGGAFGGDRHAIMEAQNNADYMDQVARSSAQLRNQGYQNAQNAAMGDVNALNQSYASNAGMAQQAGLANQAAQNARNQFVGSTANQNALTTAIQNQNAKNQMAALNAQLGTQASLANAASRNGMLGQLMGLEQQNNQFNAGQNQSADQFNAGMNFSRDQFNAGQDQQTFMNQMSAAQQMYGMGNDRWNMGQDSVNDMAGVGNQIDRLNQAYLDQAQQMFMNQQNAPQQQYQQMLAAMSGQPNWGGSQTYNPGLYDALGLGAGIGGMFLGGK